MSLVICPDCGKSISASAPACIHCGRPAQIAAPPTPQGPPAPTRSPAARSAPVDGVADVAAPVVAAAPVLRCPTCGSDDVRRLSVVHAEGLSTVETVGEPKAAVHGTRHQPWRESIRAVATSQSLASAQAAPPARKEPLLVGCVAVIMMVIAGTVLGLIASLPGFLVGAGVVGWIFWGQLKSARRWNTEEYPALLAQWQRTFRCDRCGARFQPGV